MHEDRLELADALTLTTMGTVIFEEYEDDILDVSYGINCARAVVDYGPLCHVTDKDLLAWSEEDMEATRQAITRYEEWEGHDLDEREPLLDALREAFASSPVMVCSTDDVDCFIYPQASTVDGTGTWLLER